VPFRAVFIAVVIGFALTVSAFLINSKRPVSDTAGKDADSVRASGKCAECHAQLQYSVVHEFELSAHARRGITCLECHKPAENQQKKEHHGFVLSVKLTAGNCRGCHEGIYQQFLRSGHAAVSWAAIYGEKGLSAQQVSFAEQFQPGRAKRPPHPFVALEGGDAIASGCEQCHSVGRPNEDGTIGNCTACHTRHTSSVAIARLPTTCGQCHMGPDHSQIEIYEESKHGVIFAAQEKSLNLDASAGSLTTRDMFVPTCATCHMSGLNGLKETHNPSERLSDYLADPITKKRPNDAAARASMQAICSQCHARAVIDRVYSQADKVVELTNDRVRTAQAIVDSLRNDGVLKGKPFENPIDFVMFDLWHYDGRTSKHGAFMGGADFVQWHGNYPMMQKTVQLRSMADDLRRRH
jgi:hydroxylamine dehydrogenase